MEIGYKDIYTVIGGDKTEGLKSSNIFFYFTEVIVFIILVPHI
jgi:hypothetical protein